MKEDLKKKYNWKDWTIGLFTAILITILGYYVTHKLDKNKLEKEIDTAIETGNNLITNEAYQEAITELEIILKKFSPNEFPEEFIKAENSLGIAYWILGIKTDSAASYEKAIHAHQKGLTIAVIDKFPKDYAFFNNNIGNAYMSLSSLRDKNSNLFRAINAYDNALKVHTEENYPEDFKREQHQRAMALHTLINNEDRTKDEKNAYGFYQIGYEYLKNAISARNEEYADISIKAFKQALSTYNLETNPEYYASASNALGIGYLILWDKMNNVSDLENAIVAISNTLRVYNVKNNSIEYGMAHMHLGLAYSYLSEIKDMESNIRKSILSNTEALKVFSADKKLSQELRSRIEDAHKGKYNSGNSGDSLLNSNN